MLENCPSSKYAAQLSTLAIAIIYVFPANSTNMEWKLLKLGTIEKLSFQNVGPLLTLNIQNSTTFLILLRIYYFRPNVLKYNIMKNPLNNLLIKQEKEILPEHGKTTEMLRGQQKPTSLTVKEFFFNLIFWRHSRMLTI